MSSGLEKLLVNGTEMDQELVTEILTPYIRIDKNTCGIRPQKTWSGLTAYNKILIYLLARKAMKAMGLNIDEEAASNVEIINNTGVKKGTVHPALRQLYNDGILTQTKGQKYYVPNYSIEQVKEMIMEG